MFNPKLIDFLEKNKNVTLIGTAWALYWRLALVVGGIYIVLAIVILIFGSMFK